MKVAIIAYGHADNVLCLVKALSAYAEVSVIFITSGNKFTASLFDWDVSGLPYGLTSDPCIINSLVDNRILDYIGKDVGFYIVRTPTRKIMQDVKRENLRCVKAVADFVKRKNYDVVHFNGSSGFQIYFQQYLYKMGKVYTIHDYLPHSGEASFRRRWMNIILNRLYTKCDYEFILHYKHLSSEFSRYYRVNSGRVHTVHCGPLQIYEVFADTDILEEPYTILFFGRISPYKGLKYLFDAFSEVCLAIPNAKLVVAGKGELPSCSIDDGRYEIYNHYVDNAELVSLIQRASVVVTPYTDATHSAVIMTAFAFE
jgi:glycosyltransferase involved in cell wall biosynthesis